MEQALAKSVDALAGSGPEWVFAIGALIIASVVAMKALPIYQSCKTRKLDIEEEREKRKAEEARMRNERDREGAAIQARMVDAQEAQTAALNGVQAQMAAMNGRLDASQQGSQHMAGKVDDMALQVHEIHGAVVRGGRS